MLWPSSALQRSCRAARRRSAETYSPPALGAASRREPRARRFTRRSAQSRHRRPPLVPDGIGKKCDLRYGTASLQELCLVALLRFPAHLGLRRPREMRTAAHSALLRHVGAQNRFVGWTIRLFPLWCPHFTRVSMRLTRLVPVVVLAALSGCLEREDTTAPSTGTARVRVVHASPTSSALDVSRSGAALGTALTYATVSPASAYGSSPAGPGVLLVKDASGATLFNAQIPLLRDTALTIVAVGNSGAAFPAGSARTFQPIALRDTAASPAAGGWLRIVHAADSVAANAGVATSGVDIYIYPQGSPRPTAAPTAGAAIRIINAAYRAVTGYLPLTAVGAYTVEVFVTGAAPTTATPLVATSVTIANLSKATVVARRAFVGATAAPLNAFGLVLLPE